MPIRHGEFWTCDLCGDVSMVYENCGPPHWKQVPVPDRTEDFKEIQRVVCPKCLTRIDNTEPNRELK